jgi:hypothetical protein
VARNWARGANHRPRRQGRSFLQAEATHPTRAVILETRPKSFVPLASRLRPACHRQSR